MDIEAEFGSCCLLHAHTKEQFNTIALKFSMNITTNCKIKYCHATYKFVIFALLLLTTCYWINPIIRTLSLIHIFNMPQIDVIFKSEGATVDVNLYGHKRIFFVNFYIIKRY